MERRLAGNFGELPKLELRPSSGAGGRKRRVRRCPAAGSNRRAEARRGTDTDLLDEVLSVEQAQDKMIPHIVWQNCIRCWRPKVVSSLPKSASAIWKNHHAIAAIMPRAVDRILDSKSADVGQVAQIFGLLVPVNRCRWTVRRPV